MKFKKKNVKLTINYLYKIILQNNIKFGRSQYLINKNTNIFIFKTRNDIEFFDIIDLKNILYKIFLYMRTLYLTNRNHNYFLFATTTPAYGEIIKNAALSSNTAYHVDRWTCGTITRKVDNWRNDDYINIVHFKKKKNIFNFCYFFFRYKKILHNFAPTNNLIGLFVPDIQNNIMIIREANIENIPVIGIINSNNFPDINYPIFGNNKSLFSVFFYTNLISHWITAHMRFHHEKRSSFYSRKLKKKKKESIRILEKHNYFFLFQKRYMYMLYKFQKSFRKDFLYNIFFDEADNLNINNYKEKLKTQQKMRTSQNTMFFSSQRGLNVTARLIMIRQAFQANFSGGISLTKNFFGNRFWLIFRKLLANSEEKKQKRYFFSKSLKRSLNFKYNWKWFKFSKEKLLRNKRKRIYIHKTQEAKQKNNEKNNYTKKFKERYKKNSKSFFKSKR